MLQPRHLMKCLVPVVVFGCVVTFVSQVLFLNPADSHRKDSVTYTTTRHYQLKSFGSDTELCASKCTTGKPCEYRDEVMFRVIVLTYNRPSSLEKCLQRLHDLQMGNDSLAVHIWIDRSKTGSLDKQTLAISRAFVKKFNKGTACVHVREKNAYIIGQWIDTWRPKWTSSEIGLILEDDVDVSPFVYTWLRAVTNKYNTLDIGGYTLQSENLNFHGNMKKMTVPQSETVFAYRVLGTWGFAPHPKQWSHFQDWYHEVRRNGTFKPYVQGIVPTKWYMNFEKQHIEDSMWEMWHIYHQHINNYFVVYNNLMTRLEGQKESLLSTNRREMGLHYSQGNVVNNSGKLLTKWDPAYVEFPAPEKLLKYDYEGNLL